MQGAGNFSYFMNAPHLLRLTALALVVAFPAQTVAQAEQSPGAGEHNPDLMDEVSRVDFGKDIKPILRDHCVRCHGAEQVKGGLSLHTRPARGRVETEAWSSFPETVPRARSCSA